MKRTFPCIIEQAFRKKYDSVAGLFKLFFQYLELLFSEVDIEEGPGCEYDNLEVYQGPPEPVNLFSRLCGNRYDYPVYIPGNTATVVLKSDSTYNKKGFSVTYGMISPDQLCKESIEIMCEHLYMMKSSIKSSSSTSYRVTM